VAGAERGSHSGRAILLPVTPAGFVVTNPTTGARTEFSVTPILLADSLSLAGPQLFIGILGDLREGTYTAFGTNSPRMFYADFTVPRADEIDRRFSVTSGRLTITRVTEQGVVGNFTFESRIYFDWPRNAVPGTSSTGVQTSLTLTGSFTAKGGGLVPVGLGLIRGPSAA
jgi:hypothetical protein